MPTAGENEALNKANGLQFEFAKVSTSKNLKKCLWYDFSGYSSADQYPSPSRHGGGRDSIKEEAEN